MGVQDVVARLNKSKSASTTTSHTTVVPKRKILTTPNDRVLPLSPASSPTTSIQKQQQQKEDTINSKNISNILEKFGQPPIYTSRPITTPVSTPPPSSPVISSISSTTNKKNVTHKKIVDFNKIDVTLIEMEEIFQSLLDQNKAAEEYIERLQKDVEKYSSDATKVRDYEIRVEYLALKLEQVSEERDFFEKELIELQQTPPPPKQQPVMEVESPMSPAYTYQHDIVIEDEQKLQNQNNDAYMADILNVYEEMSEEGGGGDEMQLFEDNISQQQQQECDKGMQMTIVKFITDLEKQKLETKALKQVVKKQDELITKLEAKKKANNNNNSEEDLLLKEQVELQRVELDNKRELLSQLLNEREDLLRRLSQQKRRSSIELISNLLSIESNNNNKRPTSFSSVSSGRGTPPLTAPPKHPLPPLPPPHQSPHHQ